MSFVEPKKNKSEADNQFNQYKYLIGKIVEYQGKEWEIKNLLIAELKGLFEVNVVIIERNNNSEYNFSREITLDDFISTANVID